MKIEDRLEVWGIVILIFSLIAAALLIVCAGLVTQQYSHDGWGERGIIWGYVIIGIGVFLQSLIVKQVFDGIAENIRLKRIALMPVPSAPHKNCPACDEEVREAAKVCRYCRCVLVKKEVKQ